MICASVIVAQQPSRNTQSELPSELTLLPRMIAMPAAMQMTGRI